MHNNSRKLKPDEIKTLQRLLRWRYITLSIFILVGIFLIYLFTQYNDDYNKPQFILLVSLGTVVVFIFGSLFTYKLRLDIGNGKVHIKEEEITKKLDYEGDDPGIGGAVHRYFFYTGRIRHSVKKEVYFNGKVGRHYYIPVTPHSKTQFDITVEAN